MLYGFHCLDCDYEWEDEGSDYPKECLNCNSDEFEETYELECRDCDYKFIGAENDSCPECESIETYEI